MEAVKTILTLPYKLGSVVDKVNHSIDSLQFSIRQPKHCVVLSAALWRWQGTIPSVLETEQSLLPNIEEIDITQKVQTLWSLYEEHEQLECASALEFLARLNLLRFVAEPDKHWLIMLAYRCQPGSPIYCYSVKDTTERFRFPPYDTQKRLISTPRYKKVQLGFASGENKTLTFAEFSQLYPHSTPFFGPKRNLYCDTGCATSTWILLRVLGRQNPEILRLELLTE